jgi:hypothetical protein
MMFVILFLVVSLSILVSLLKHPSVSPVMIFIEQDLITKGDKSAFDYV